MSVAKKNKMFSRNFMALLIAVCNCRGWNCNYYLTSKYFSVSCPAFAVLMPKTYTMIMCVNFTKQASPRLAQTFALCTHLLWLTVFLVLCNNCFSLSFVLLKNSIWSICSLTCTELRHHGYVQRFSPGQMCLSVPPTPMLCRLVFILLQLSVFFFWQYNANMSGMLIGMF